MLRAVALLTALVSAAAFCQSPGILLTYTLGDAIGRAGSSNAAPRPHPGPTSSRQRRSRAQPCSLHAAAYARKNIPLITRAKQIVPSLAAFFCLAMPTYIAPQHAEARERVEETRKQPSRSPLGIDQAATKIKEQASLFEEILADLQDLYVEPVDLDRLAEMGFQAMLNSLDPYTEFENIHAAETMRTQTMGSYSGVGLVIAKNHDKDGKDKPYLHVQNALEGFAYDDGMRKGDTLVEVDGKDVRDASTDDVRAMLKGEPGSNLELKFKRPGIDGVQTCHLTRKIVLLRNVPLGMTLGMDTERIGYVKLQKFGTSAAAELAYIIGQLQAESTLEGLILDLRGNPGGLLSSAIKVSQLFIREGENIVTIRGRALSTGPEAASTAETRASDVVSLAKTMTSTASESESDMTFQKTYSSDPIDVPVPGGRHQVVFHPPLLNTETKLVVLVDKGTASAAEIVSGAIQDHDRGVILGETTYGKGLVQQLKSVGQGGQQIKFTIGKYYTPSGRCIQSKSYTSKDGQLGTFEVGVKEQNRRVYYTDKGRQVRDGGGIEPDIVKKAATIPHLERELDRQEMFFDYSSVYEAKHVEDGEKLARAPQPLVTSEVYADFQQFVLKETGNEVESQFDKSLEIMKKALEETGYTEATPEVDKLQVKLNKLTKEEFKKYEASLKKRLDMELRARFVPEAILKSMALQDDPFVDEAYSLIKDSQKFGEILGSSKHGMGEEKADDELKGSPDKTSLRGRPADVGNTWQKNSADQKLFVPNLNW